MALSSFTSGTGNYEMQFYVQRAVGAYTDEVYTNARKLSGTGIVGADASINVNIEDFIGQLRWYKPLTPIINVATTADATAGTPTEFTTAFAKYAKTVRTHGARQVNVQTIISQQDGLSKIARDFGETQAQDEHNSILECLKGLAAYEVTRGGGIVSFSTDADTGSVGFFVDINAAGVFGAAATNSGDERRLIATHDPASTVGAMRAEALFKAMGMAWKDYESDYYYLVTGPELMADLRSANLVDSTVVTEGNLTFQTIFNGKFRLVMTRASQGDNSASANVNDRSVKTTFVVKPSAMTMKSLAVPTPVEIERAAAAFKGGGTTDVWYRWGYVLHPMGYNWNGSETQFVQTAGTGGYDQAGSWTRSNVGYLNLGILPIFHA
jgi:hypothetical protein